MIDERLGDVAARARDLGNLALVPEARGDLEGAERLYREALDLAERVGATRVVATKLSNLGDIALARGRAGEARALWTRAMRLFEGLGAERYRAQCERSIAGLGAIGTDGEEPVGDR